MLNRFQTTITSYPRPFRILVVSSFVDRLGGTLIFPFFSLYITQKFGVGMTQAGVLLAIYSVSGLVGSMIGGALTDRFGRRSVVLFGLVISGLSSVLMGLVNDLTVFYFLAAFTGLLSDVSWPAYQAMVADLLPERQRAEGFGVIRVAQNMAWIGGPLIGGLIATRSYLALFILDAISSVITAAIVYRSIPETRPKPLEEAERGSMFDTLKGYRRVASDRFFLAFMLTSMMMSIVYLQMYSTLSVYLRDVHGIPARGFGYLLSANAATVVLLQFWVTRQTVRYPPLLMMALGTSLYLVGFTAYGFTSTYLLFLIAMLIITMGEMIVIPVSQAVATRLAPADMRGRYMAFFGLAWTIPATIGPWAAGIILDNYDPRWVWYASGILTSMAASGFLLLQTRSKERLAAAPDEPALPEPSAGTVP